MATRSVTMPDGTVIDGVPDNISDADINARYQGRFGSAAQKTTTQSGIDPSGMVPTMRAQLEEAAAKSGYPLEAGRGLGFSDAQLQEFVKAHPNYWQEKTTQKEVEAMPEWQKQVHGFLQGIRETGVGLKQLWAEMGSNLGFKGPEDAQAMRQQAGESIAQSYGTRAGGGAPGYFVAKVLEAYPPAVIAKLGGIPKITAFLDRAGLGAIPKAGEVLSGTGSQNALLRYGGAAGQGALYGLAEPVQGDESKIHQALQAMAFSVGGQAFVDSVRKYAPVYGPKAPSTNPIQALLTPSQAYDVPERVRLGQLADKYGYELPLAARTGAPWAAGLQAAMESLPLAPTNLKRMQNKNINAGNMQLLSSIGVGTVPNRINEINPTVLDRADTAIGQKLDIVERQRVKLYNKDFGQDVQNALDKYEVLEQPSQAVVDMLAHWKDLLGLKMAQRTSGGVPILDASRNPIGVTVDGAKLLANRSTIGQEATDAFKAGDTQMAQAKRALVEAIDQAVERSLPAGQKGLYSEAREQYRNLMTIRMAYDNDATPGFVNPARLKTALATQYSKQQLAIMPSGTNALNDVARIADAFKLKFPDSGTAGRQTRSNLVMDALRSPLAPGVGGGAAGGMLAGPPGAVMGFMAPYAALPAVGGLGTSSTLGRILTNPMTEEQARMLAIQIRSGALGIGPGEFGNRNVLRGSQ